MSEAQVATPIENGAPPPTQEIAEEPGFKVFVGNLAYATTEEGLRTFFEVVKDDILSAQVIMRGTRSAGYGFVALNTSEAVEKAATELDKKELDGRQVQVQAAKGKDQKDEEKKERKARRKAGRRGSKAVPGEVSEAEATGEPKTEGEATGADETQKPKKKKKSKSRKSKAARIDGEESPAAEGEAGEAAKKTRKPKAPRVPRPAGEAPEGEPSKNMLFVANLGFNVDDAGLSALFTDAGVTVLSARIVRKRWGQPRRSKGFGFVDVGDEAAQKKAIELLDGKDIEGRPVAVKVAVNAPPHDEDGEASPDAPAAPAAGEAAPASTDAPAAAPAPAADTPAAPAAGDKKPEKKRQEPDMNAANPALLATSAGLLATAIV